MNLNVCCLNIFGEGIKIVMFVCVTPLSRCKSKSPSYHFVNQSQLHTTPLTDSSWSPLFSPPWRLATPPGITLEMQMGEFCSLPPMMLNPRPSSVLGSSTTLGWAWPSLAAKAATVAWSEEQSHDHHTEINWLSFDCLN